MNRQSIVALFALSVGWLGPGPAAAQKPGSIWVVGGTYGKNCGAPHGNTTGALARACNGRRACAYTINYKVIGDPRPGCSKDYLAEWRCIGSPRIHAASAAPEAGFNKRVQLSCAGAPPPGVHPPEPPPPPHSGGGIQIVAGTYGGNCGAGRGNKSRHLARACNGRRVCAYTINHRVIGDPKVGCGKDYVAEWRCAGSPTLRRVRATPEAGFNKRITLSCGAPPPPPPPGHGPVVKPGRIRVLAGTYGRNCGAGRGNKTGHLARACNGRADCVYTINYRVIGDPKVGCSKDYVAEWTCSGRPGKRQARVSPEAGFNKQVRLSCGR